MYKYCILFLLIIGISSCSISFEKRRYRPGYHVDVVQSNHRIKSNAVNNESVAIDNNDLEPKLLTIKPSTIENGSIKPATLTTKNKTTILKTSSNSIKTNKLQIKNNKSLARHIKNIQLNKVLETKKTNISNGRKIAAWILGGISILIAIIMIILAAMSGSFGVVYIYFGLPGPALLGIIALLVRFIKSKTDIKQDKVDKVFKPVSTGFVNASFIFSIITLGLALIGFILRFLIYPIGLVGFIMSAIAAICSIVTFSLGFRALKDDKSIKTKLTIIFGFIALILAIIGIILILL